MWLLDTKSFKLSFFQGSNIPKYAILSHRWENEEITFDEVQGPKKAYRARKAWRKVIEACHIASKDELQYIWIDTCCIDKRSSAELSEAINSMYQWYSEAEVCYAYLFDVTSFKESFKRSTWFLRSWTLQELLAPRQLLFFDSGWFYLGTWQDHCDAIASVTSIDRKALRDKLRLDAYSIAQRMSWAAKRDATRPEDVAYSLLGLFQINMPLLYGEGSRAFKRLQQEIMRQSNDLSILTWMHDDSDPNYSNGVLAYSPKNFTGCDRTLEAKLTSGYTFNNAGISLTLDLRPVSCDGLARYYSVHLHHATGDCQYLTLCREWRSGIYCRVLGSHVHRPSQCPLSEVRRFADSSTLFLTKSIVLDEMLSSSGDRRPACFRISHCPTGIRLYTKRKSSYQVTEDFWDFAGAGDKHDINFQIPPMESNGMVAYLSWQRSHSDGREGSSYVFAIGHDFDFDLIVLAFRIKSCHCNNPLRHIPPRHLLDVHTNLASRFPARESVYDAHRQMYALRMAVSDNLHKFPFAFLSALTLRILPERSVNPDGDTCLSISLQFRDHEIENTDEDLPEPDVDVYAKLDQILTTEHEYAVEVDDEL